METRMLKAADGIDLYVTKNAVAPAKAVLVIVHGLCEHSGRYAYVTDWLNAAGLTVYRFDNRGHGRSGGERGYLDDFRDFIRDADTVVTLAEGENPGLPVFMLGHSLGGFIAAAFGVTYPGRLAGQILSGAATTVSPLLAELEGVDLSASAHEPIANTLSDLISRDPAVVRDYREDPLNLKEFKTKLMSEALLRGARWLMDHLGEYTCPCLILHGGGDQIVSPDASRYFADHIASPEKRLLLYDGLYHEILNEPEKDRVLTDILSWIRGSGL